MSKWDPRPTTKYTDQAIIFQTLDWYCEDVENDNGKLEYCVYVFGITQDNTPVTVLLKNYFPFFFIEIPSKSDSTFIYTLKESLGRVVKSVELIERKKYYGFENNKIRKFLKLSFYNFKSFKSLRYRIQENSFQIGGKDYRFPLYESNIDPILRLTHIRDILTAGWVKIENYTFDEELYSCLWTSVKNCPEPEFNNKLSNIRVMYFDIEACSEDGSFPNALKPNDRVTQICCINKDTSTGLTSKYLFNLGTIDSVEDTTVMQFKTEKALLLRYSEFVRETDPDIIVGYNIFGFDNGYLFERAKVLEIEGSFNYQSKLPGKRTDILKKILNNQQSGFNDWKMTHLVGRIHIDLLQVIKKDFKLESYKLDYVGEYFLKQGKDDVSPKEIFEAWNQTHGTREKRTRVGKYCVQDTNLCLLLFEKFAVLANHIEMAKVTRVPVEYLVTRGQSIKVFSQIAYETRKAGYLIPILPKMETEGKFQGATVLEAHIGYYTRPVCGLDFASLYPSIMIAHNMCYSTVVLDPKYLNLPGVEYSTISCGNDMSFSFVQNQPGVLSGILQSLWKNRKVTKKEMNAATDPFVKTVLNAKQLAIKVSMNSIYGFTGATVGALPCLEISQSVTGCGRLMIEQTQKHAVEMFQCEIVYGDSVTADTPVLIRENGRVYTDTIEYLFNRFDKEDYPQFKAGEPGLTNKEQSIPRDIIQVWTASGWSPLKRTIRHYCTKKIYRVVTHTGCVDVTEDHSLLNENLEQIKPDRLFENTTLFHSFPNNLEHNPHDFMGYEDVFEHHNPSVLQNKYLKWRSAGYGVEIEYNGKFILKRYSKFQEQINSQKKVTRIINLGPTQQFVYDLETEDGTFQAGIGQMIVKNTDSCYVIFPQPVDPDGSLTTLFKVAEDAAKKISETFKKPIELEFEKFLFPFTLFSKKRYIYREWTDPVHGDSEISSKGTVLSRRDNAPIVKESIESILNTLMFENNLVKSVSEAERYIDQLLSGKVPIKKLILSKTLRNDYKGFEKVYSGDNNYRWVHTKETREKDSDTGKNVKTGKMEKIEECPNMGHVALVEKLRKRDLNSAPKPGDRVPFVYINTGNPLDTSAQKTEDPGYVTENNIPIDYLYYYEHQLQSPLESIFNIIIGETKCKKLLYQGKSYLEAKKKEKELVADSKRKKEGNRDIRGFFKLKLT